MSSIYFHLKGDGRPLLGYPDRIEKLKRFKNIIIDLGTLCQYPDLQVQLQERSTLQAYVVMQAANWPGPFFQDLFAMVKRTGGFCWNTSGGYWLSNINMANHTTVLGIVDLVKQYAATWNGGAFFDVLVSRMPPGQEDIDYRRNGYSTMGEFVTAWNAGVDLLGSSFAYPVVGNYGPVQAPGFNGNMHENFPRLPPGTWTGIMDHVLHDTYRAPRMVWLAIEPAGLDPKSPANQRLARYGYGSSLLADGTLFTFGRGADDDMLWKAAHCNFWYEMFDLPLGAPEGMPYRYRDGSWRRPFANGLVVVNPTSQLVKVHTEVPMRPGNVAWKKDFNVQPSDGLILVR